LWRYGGEGVTLVHPLVLVLVILACVLMLYLPRPYLPIPLIVAMVLVPPAQRLVVGGFDLTMARIVLGCGWLRLLLGSTDRPPGRNPIDVAVVYWVLSSTIAYTLLYGNSGAFINRLGFAYDVLGAYFLMRATVTTEQDVRRVLKALVAVAVVVGCLVVIEVATQANPLAEFGTRAHPEIRRGRVRAEGPFSHPIMAGTFGATLAPLAVALCWMGAGTWGVVGSIAAIVITGASASSGPAFTWVAGLLAVAMWPLRRGTAWMRNVAIGALVLLHVLMNGPVWSLLSRVNVVEGSTGWYRYYLMDNFINRLGEWALVGTRFTGAWGHGLHDRTSQYVSLGVSGGLITLFLFVFAVRRVLVGLREARARAEIRWQRACWATSSALVAHLVAFVGVAYFGQMADVWYWQLGLMSAMTSLGMRVAPARVASEGSRARWIQMSEAGSH
jgi:hypothetical protein